MLQDKITEIVGSFGSDGQFGKAFLVAFFVLVLLFFATREFVCWYFRLSRMVDLMKLNNAQLEQLTAEMSLLRRSLEPQGKGKSVPAQLSTASTPETTQPAAAPINQEKKDWTS